MSLSQQPRGGEARGGGTIRNAALLAVIVLSGLIVVRRHMESREAMMIDAVKQLKVTASVDALEDLQDELLSLSERAAALSGTTSKARAEDDKMVTKKAKANLKGKAKKKLKRSDGRKEAQSSYYDAELDYDFEGTAIVTMIAGNAAARGAIALIQSLRDTHTRVHDILVMLSRGGEGSPECRDMEWKASRGREEVDCHGPDTIEEEIVSSQYLDILRNGLGATLEIFDPIPSTVYTEGIPGGRSTFWGMALNKLRVFNMTRYKKALWMDSDTLVFKVGNW